ncbi:uncharacterized protein LOC117269063 isoform X2 [Epinephelus lanceolatus]
MTNVLMAVNKAAVLNTSKEAGWGGGWVTETRTFTCLDPCEPEVILRYFLLADEPKADENCAFKYPSTEKWESDKCSSKHTFLCFNERLVLVKERKTWEQALQHCRALEAVNSNQPATDYQNHRYDLATLHSPDDHKYAREKAKYAPTNEVWTGLRYLAGQWVWVGGERVQYLGMKSCPTLRFCGTLPKNITKIYNIRDCSQKRSFLCYRKP